MCFTLDHDETSESVKESVERSGDILFIGVFWKDGCALDMILQAVDSEGNERSVTDSDSIFTDWTSQRNKETESHLCSQLRKLWSLYQKFT